jgi:DNA-directed RNA polymerase subunit RPC12/RpoP
MPRGKKSCPSCSFETGPRAYSCPECNHIFVFKPKSKESKNTKVIAKVNWRELVKGDRIKVAGGPYFFSKGDFIPMGYRGRFVVDSIDENGILAWGVDRHSGFCHIYMGGDIQDKQTNVWKTKHKLMKLKNKEQTV